MILGHDGGILRVQFHPLFKPRLGIGLYRLGRAFGLAHAAIDALVGIDDEHVVALVEAIDRADLHAVHIFASDAVVGNDEGHRSGLWRPRPIRPIEQREFQALGDPRRLGPELGADVLVEQLARGFVEKRQPAFEQRRPMSGSARCLATGLPL